MVFILCLTFLMVYGRPATCTDHGFTVQVSSVEFISVSAI